MASLEELLKRGEKVVKGEKKKPGESEIKERYNLESLVEIAKQTLKSGEAYKYPHKEFAEVIGFDPVGKIKRTTNSAGITEDEYNISLPSDLRAFIENKPIEGFDDTVRIRMSRDEKVIVEPYKDYKNRVDNRRKRRRKKGSKI